MTPEYRLNNPVYCNIRAGEIQDIDMILCKKIRETNKFPLWLFSIDSFCFFTILCVPAFWRLFSG